MSGVIIVGMFGPSLPLREVDAEHPLTARPRQIRAKLRLIM
jgi:hypothetical protein